MVNNNIYNDISKRTDGDIYIGIVGPVRTGKSTFIKKFMETLVIPNIDSTYRKERAVDELPQSAAGKTIMTTEPKFIPEEAVEVNLENGAHFNVRMIDCVGYIVPSSLGYIENEMPRMVMTPWFDEEVPFNMAAEVGTQKVISEHSTIGIVVTTDGSISDIPREEYEECEERVISELKSIEKPFVIVMNSADPYSKQTRELCESLSEKYETPVVAVNCLELSEDDIKNIMKEVLFSFPVKEINISCPKWITSLKKGNWLKDEIFTAIRDAVSSVSTLRDIQSAVEKMKDCSHISSASVTNTDLGTGSSVITVNLCDSLFYEIISEETGRESLISRIRTPLGAFPEALEEPGFLAYNTYAEALPVVGCFFPVVLERVIRREVSMEYQPRDPAQVRSEAAQAALKHLKTKHFGDEIIDKWVDYCMIEGGSLAATATVEWLMDIGGTSVP